MGGLVATSKALVENILNVETDAKDPNIGFVSCPVIIGNGYKFGCTENIRIDYRDRYLELDKDTRAKDWKSDHTRGICQDCKIKFSSVTRKHHCRFCGDIFCNSCSSIKVCMKDIYERANREINFLCTDKVERICNQCYRKMLKVDCEFCQYSFCLVCGNAWHDKMYC